jgi:hypothetical protein
MKVDRVLSFDQEQYDRLPNKSYYKNKRKYLLVDVYVNLFSTKSKLQF